MSAARLDGGFPVGHCARCAKDVLAWVQLDERDEERRLCVHCDAELDPLELRVVMEQELDGVGYATHAETENCGRPDCGGGRCGKG